MESGAILLYLAEKTGKLWPQDFPVKWRVVESVAVGRARTFSRAHHFVRFNPGKSVYVEERHTKEAKRLWGVLDRRLAEVDSPILRSGLGSLASPGRRWTSPTIPM
jgi:GSH-dependent disulfide-bond oxidoreductase